MDIYLIRHTTPKVEKGICYGQTDLDLAHDFSAEFKTVLKTLPKERFNVYSSPLKRCRLLAEEIGSSISYDSRLKELNFGTWEMKAWDAIPKNEIDPWMKNFVTVAVPNGESYEQLASRVNDFFSDLNISNNLNTVIVTHSGFIRACLASLMEIPLKDSFGISIPYGSIFKLEKTEKTFKVVSEIEMK